MADQTPIAAVNSAGPWGSVAAGSMITQPFTKGNGVHVVYDSVGKTTYEGSLNVLRPFGMLVLFGQSSGPVPPIDPLLLHQKGSLFLTWPSLAHHGEPMANKNDNLSDAATVIKSKSFSSSNMNKHMKIVVIGGSGLIGT